MLPNVKLPNAATSSIVGNVGMLVQSGDWSSSIGSQSSRPINASAAEIDSWMDAKTKAVLVRLSVAVTDSLTEQIAVSSDAVVSAAVAASLTEAGNVAIDDGVSVAVEVSDMAELN